jgi:hypothetical protein
MKALDIKSVKAGQIFKSSMSVSCRKFFAIII